MSEKQKKIIMIDDVNYHLLSIKERLKGKYEFFPAQNVEILEEILEKVRPDVFLLDLNMPDVDGFQVLEKLKSDHRVAQIPVILFTGKSDKKSAFRAMELGASDYITKPISDEILIESIENQIDMTRQMALKPIVLAVDDAPSILQTINNALKNLYTVYTVPHPELVSEVLKKVTPDIFILDLQMPKVTGFELVPMIREDPLHKETPIVFLTTEATNDNVMVAAHHLRVTDFLVKPINDELLRNKMETHLASYIIRRSIRNLGIK